MPAKNEKQRKLFAAAKACKEGKGKCKGEYGKIAKELPLKEISKFTKKKK